VARVEADVEVRHERVQVVVARQFQRERDLKSHALKQFKSSPSAFSTRAWIPLRAQAAS
jgi:hypothetical protein